MSSEHQDGAVADPEVPQPAARKYLYCCCRCRSMLFRSDQLVPHDPTQGAAGHKKFRYDRVETGTRPQCTSHFLDGDLVPWVKDPPKDSAEEENTLYCPHCRCKIGARSWVGAQCSCGIWVVPSFKVHSSRVDEFAIP